jgi:hypothetical protein
MRKRLGNPGADRPRRQERRLTAQGMPNQHSPLETPAQLSVLLRRSDRDVETARPRLTIDEGSQMPLVRC